MTGSDILVSLSTSKQDDPLKPHGINFPPIEKKGEFAPADHGDPSLKEAENVKALRKENAQSLQKLVKSLMLILETLKSRRDNVLLDKAIKQLGANTNYEETKRPLNTSPSPATDEEKKLAAEEDSKSTCLSIVKMTMFNLQNILQQVLDSDLADHFEVEFSDSQI